MNAALRLAGITAAGLIALVVPASCGKSVSSSPANPMGIASGNAAVTEVLAAPVPEGVDPALWDALTQELAVQLTVCVPSSLKNLEVTWWARSQGISWDDRFMRPDGSANGVVDIADITPIALYYGEDVSRTGGHGDYDYNSDGYIDVRDITPIAQLFGFSCGGFVVEFSHEGADSGFFRVASVDYDDYDTSFRWGFRRAFFVPCDTRTREPLWVRLRILDQSSKSVGQAVFEVPVDPHSEPCPRELAIFQTGAPAPTISWSTMSLGLPDGNQDGITNWFDLGPIGELFGWQTGDARECTVADYDRDGRISIADVTGLAVAFSYSIGRFQVEVSTESAEEGFLPNGSVDFFASRGFNEFGFRWYEYAIASPPEGVPFWVRVVPYSFNDLPGTPSNAVLIGGEE